MTATTTESATLLFCPLLREPCKGKGCMMYRGIPGKRENYGADQQKRKESEGWTMTTEPASYGYYFTYPETGYCGLAGPVILGYVSR